MGAIDSLYGLYQRSPVAFQNLMVSLYGRALRGRRYGREHDETLAELNAMMSWDRERLAELQFQRLRETLEYAGRHVPYYKRTWKELGFDPRDVKSYEDFTELPVLEKDVVRENPRDFVSETYKDVKLHSGNTSGTTGKPLSTFKDRGCYQRVWAYQTRQRQIWGITGKRPRVSIGVRPVVPMSQTKPPFWRHDRSEDNWLFSNFHMDEATLDSYVDKIVEIDPEEINAYPSGVYLVAAHAQKRGETRIRPAAVVTCAETLYDEQRRVIEETFGCKVADQYGAAEVVFWVGQCQEMTYHVAPEFGLMEAVKGSRPVRGEMGDAVGTGFVNRAQVLIRYRLGDSIILSETPRECACGWQTDTMERVIGRIDDVLYAPDGRALGRLDILMKKIDGVLEAQLVQDEPDHLTVKLVAVEGPVEGVPETLDTRIKELFGAEMRVDCEWVESIARTRAGKFRYQLNLVGPPETWKR